MPAQPALPGWRRAGGGDGLRVETLPRLAARDLDRHAVAFCRCRHVGVADQRRNLEPCRQLAAESRIGIGVGAADVMMEMREPREHELTARGELAKQEQHRN